MDDHAVPEPHVAARLDRQAAVLRLVVQEIAAAPNGLIECSP